MYPKVEKIKPIKPSFLEFQFSNGEIKIFDVSNYWNSHFFSQLQQWNYFIRVQIKNGTVTWPNEQDFAPETIYLDSKRINEF